MKKILSLFVMFLLMFSFSGIEVDAAINKKINANIKTKKVPAGSVITLKLLEPIDSATMSLGDRFDLMVAENVIVNNSVVIPKGSVIRGSIEEVKAPSMLYKGGMLRLYFDHIVSPTGKQVPFYAGICNNKNVTYDGALSSNTTYKTAITKTMNTTKNIVVKPTSWAWEKGENLFNGVPKYIFAPITAVVSAPVAGIYFVGDSIADVFKKGENFSMNQGDTLQVQLIKSIDMPAY